MTPDPVNTRHILSFELQISPASDFYIISQMAPGSYIQDHCSCVKFFTYALILRIKGRGLLELSQSKYRAVDKSHHLIA